MSKIQLPAVKPKQIPWNKGRLVGQKHPLLPKQVWAIRARLELAGNLRDLALFNLAIDSKLRGCDLVRLKVSDLVIGDRVRGISMHPELDADIAFGDQNAFEAWAQESARVKLALNILDGIRDRGEKALLFLEYKAAQRTKATGLAARYGLSSEPMIINGDVRGPKRQPMVGEFQAGAPGFDVMILSPRAAGVGLTITAANHVIHLSRWWNPAVEDQCNDRVYRIGQDKPVTVHVPLAVHPSYEETSFDLKLDGLLQRKRALSHDLLAPPESRGDANELFSSVVSEAKEGNV